MSALPVNATDQQLMELAMSAPQGYGRTWRALFQAGIDAERARTTHRTGILCAWCDEPALGGALAGNDKGSNQPSCGEPGHGIAFYPATSP